MKTRELVMLARAISERHDVDVQLDVNGKKVTASAARSSVTGRHVITLPPSEGNSQEADMILRGLLDHEVGHVRFTKFGEREADGVFPKAVVNIFEDAYVEYRMGKAFPGSKANLARLARHLFNDEWLKDNLKTCAIINGDNWLVAVVQIHALLVRRQALDSDLFGGETGHEKVLATIAGKMGAEWTEKLDSLATNVDMSTWESNRQAAEDYINHVLAACACRERAGQATMMSCPVNMTMTDIRECGNARLEEELSRPLPNEVRREVNAASLVVEAATNAARSEVETITMGDKGTVVATQRKPLLVSALQRTIPPLLQSLQMRPVRTSRRGASLDCRRLHRVAAHDDRVFVSRAPHKVKRVDVGLLVDYSSSVSYAEKDMNDVALAMMTMLKSIPGVRSFMYGFKTSCIRCLIPVSQSSVSGKVRLLTAAGGTPTAEALMASVKEFDMNRDVRRLLFTLTDGQPNSPANTHAVMRFLQNELGIELYGVGLEGMNLSTYYDDDHWIQSMSCATDLAPKMGNMLRKALTKAVSEGVR